MCVCVCVCVCVVGSLWAHSPVAGLLLPASKTRFSHSTEMESGGWGACGEEAPGSLDCFWSRSQLLGLSCFHLHPARVNDYPPPQLQPIRIAPAFLDSCHLRWSPSLLKVHLWSLAPGSQPWGQKAARQDGKYSGITTRFLTLSGPNFSWIKDVKVKWEPKF